jgi:hypothetical protein
LKSKFRQHVPELAADSRAPRALRSVDPIQHQVHQGTKGEVIFDHEQAGST